MVIVAKFSPVGVKIIQVDGVLATMTIFFFCLENWSETFIKNEPKVQKQRKKKGINPRLNYRQLAKENNFSRQK